MRIRGMSSEVDSSDTVVIRFQSDDGSFSVLIMVRVTDHKK